MEYQGEMIQLRESSKDCELDLIRGKDLRYFMEYKKWCFAMSTVGAELTPSIAADVVDENQQPKDIKDLLEEFSLVFQQPVSLPPIRACDHKILLKPRAQPFKLKPCRYPHS